PTVRQLAVDQVAIEEVQLGRQATSRGRVLFTARCASTPSQHVERRSRSQRIDECHRPGSRRLPGKLIGNARHFGDGIGEYLRLERATVTMRIETVVQLVSAEHVAVTAVRRAERNQLERS